MRNWCEINCVVAASELMKRTASEFTMEKVVRAALFCAFLAIAADYANGLYPVIMSELHLQLHFC